jgi:DNA-binding response OmpR family regulator
MDGAILLIESDLGDAFRLGRALDNAGFQTFPARTAANAAVLLRELHLTVDVLILDCSVPGAEDFITILRRSRKLLRVICLNEDATHKCSRATQAVCPKPTHLSELSIVKWAQEVGEMLLSTADLRSYWAM